MSGERVAEGILGAFFGSFVGAPLGQQAAGLVTNLLASGIYEVCGGVARDLKARGNHNIQKLAAASLRSAVEAGKRECAAAWGPAAVMRLDELQREAEKTLVAMDTEPSRQLVEALLVGRPEDMEEVIGRLIEDYVQGQCHDFRQVKADLAPRFFLHFREKYVSDEFAAGRQELERDIAWATLQQGQQIKALVFSLGAGIDEKFVAFQEQLNRIERNEDQVNWGHLKFDEVIYRLQELKKIVFEDVVEPLRKVLSLTEQLYALTKANNAVIQENESLRRALAESQALAAELAKKIPAGISAESDALIATALGRYEEAERIYALIDNEKSSELARIKQQRGDNALRAHHLIDAARFYVEAYALEPTDERNDQCGYLLGVLGYNRQALPYLDRRVARFEADREAMEHHPEYRNGLAMAYMNRGNAKCYLPDLPGAGADYGNAITIREELRSLLEAKGQWNPEYRNDLARAYMNRGNAKHELVDLPGAVEDYTVAIVIMEELRQITEPDDHWNPAYRNDLAGAYANRGNAKQVLLDLPGALADYRIAITLMEGLRDDLEPKGQWNPGYRNDLASGYMNRGNAKCHLPDLPGAIKDHGIAITIREELRNLLEPKGQWNPGYRNDLAKTYMNRGVAKEMLQAYPAALEDYGAAITVREELRNMLEPVGQWNPGYLNELARAYGNRGIAKKRIGDLPGAVDDLKAAVTLMEYLRRLLETDRKWNPEYRNDLALAYTTLARLLISFDLSESINRSNEAIHVYTGLVSEYPVATWPMFFRKCYRLALETRINAYLALKEYDLAAADERRAREIPD